MLKIISAYQILKNYLLYFKFYTTLVFNILEKN
jgi:hypothetical protein